MARIGEMEQYLEAQWPILYAQSKDYAYFMHTLKSMQAGKRNIYLWEPSRLTCVYFKKSSSDVYNPALDNFGNIIARDCFNKDSDFDIPVEDVLIGVNRQVYRLPAAFPTIERESIIVIMLPRAAQCNSVEFRAALIKAATEQLVPAADITLLFYSPESLQDTVISEYGVYLEPEYLTDDQITEHMLSMAKHVVPMANRTRSELYCHNKDVVKYVIPALRGFERYDVINTLALCNTKYAYDTDSKNIINEIDKFKMQTISQNDMLSYLPAAKQVDPKYIGGFGAFLKYMEERALAFSPEAVALRIDPPRGVVLVGLPGTGKSMSAKALSQTLKLPTVFMDISAAFGSFVGESESKMAKALKLVDSLKGCILVIDEADKGLAGASGPSGDSGTARRVLGKLLTWLQEQQSNTFVIITMNNPETIPPEFLRAGRFDKIFYVDLPNNEDRRDIIAAQFAKRGTEVEELGYSETDWQALLTATDSFTGAELEETIKEARMTAFHARKTAIPTIEEMLQKTKERVPLAKSHPEQIEALRRWKTRAVPVSLPRKAASVTIKKVRI